MTDLAFVSAIGQAAALRDGAISSRELLEHVLARVAERNGDINAVVVDATDSARTRAADADAAQTRGEWWGPLHGVPITVKECFEVEGLPTTAGSTQMADHVSKSTAVAVQRLLDAGAIVYGKTNTPFMAGDFQTYNEIYGTTGNPWDPDRVPGGSSGGSAAAVAAGFSSIELGSDIGGSIRNPAHFCGVHGHKPSHGIVPMRGHVPGPPGMRSVADLAVAGPLARHASDLTAVLDLIAGPDDWEGAGWRLDLPASRHEALSDFRVGVLLDDPRCPVSSAVGDVIGNAADQLASAGVTVVDSRPALDLARSHALYLQLLFGQEAADYPKSVRDRFDVEIEQLAREDVSRHAQLVRGVSQRHRHWLAVNERRHRLRERWADWFSSHDLLLCPITPTTAFSHDHSPLEARTLTVDGTDQDYWSPLFWAGLATSVYLPATAIPAGLAGGLPVGFQVIGPYLEDRTCLRFAELAEPVLGGAPRPPGF